MYCATRVLWVINKISARIFPVFFSPFFLLLLEGCLRVELFISLFTVLTVMPLSRRCQKSRDADGEFRDEQKGVDGSRRVCGLILDVILVFCSTARLDDSNPFRPEFRVSSIGKKRPVRVCDGLWQRSARLTRDARFLKYLRDKRIVCFRDEDGESNTNIYLPRLLFVRGSEEL